VTGGENGLGGITRPVIGRVSFDSSAAYYAVAAYAVAYLLWRFHRSPVGLAAEVSTPI